MPTSILQLLLIYSIVFLVMNSYSVLCMHNVSFSVKLIICIKSVLIFFLCHCSVHLLCCFDVVLHSTLMRFIVSVLSHPRNHAAPAGRQEDKGLLSCLPPPACAEHGTARSAWSVSLIVTEPRCLIPGFWSSGFLRTLFLFADLIWLRI